MNEVSELPRYRLVQPFYVDDRKLEPGIVIEYAGIPNEAMDPLNEPARKAMKKFLTSLGPAGRTPPVEEVMEQAMRNRPREPAPLTGTVRIDGIRPPEAKPETATIVADEAAHPSQSPVRVQGTVKDERPREPQVGG